MSYSDNSKNVLKGNIELRAFYVIELFSYLAKSHYKSFLHVPKSILKITWIFSSFMICVMGLTCTKSASIFSYWYDHFLIDIIRHFLQKRLELL